MTHEQLHCQVPAGFKARLERQTQIENRTITAIVVEAVEAYLKQRQVKPRKGKK